MQQLWREESYPHEIEAKHHPEIHRHCAPDSLCLIFLIPDLSLRAYVFLISPKSALTMEYVEDKEAWDFGRRAERQYDDLPYHKEYPSCRGNGP